jgi:hypothetical protein
LVHVELTGRVLVVVGYVRGRRQVVAAAKDSGIYTLQTTPDTLLNIIAAAGKAVISWTIPSIGLQLEESSEVTGTNWTSVGIPPSLNLANLRNQVTVPITGHSAFYRLTGF